MTQAKSTPAQMETASELPMYESVVGNTPTITEKQGPKHCSQHGSNSTPAIDAQLHRPTAKEAVESMHTALRDAVDGEHCTRCTANDVLRTLTKYVFDLREAKKSGNFSRQEKKALKVEVKGLLKEVKGVIREEKMSRKA